ncbi:MAG: T9SS type A sorting domain-containing protein, partial [Chitinophagaceae bacterium]
YTVVVTNATGCSITSAATTVLVNPLPIATITPGGPLTFPVGGNVLLNASAGVGNTYQWKKDGINITGATAAAYTATTGGTYTVIITNSNLCQATSQPVQVSVSPAPAITKGRSSLRQAEKDQMNPEPVIKVFPNPLHGDEYLNFEWNISNADKSIKVTVFDISGRRIESRFLNSSGKKLKINGVSGIYMVEIRWGKNERKIFRIIKF